MTDCIFCQIVEGSIPAPRLYEDRDFIVIPDKYPKAPVHLLVIPKIHIASLDDLKPDHEPLLGRAMAILPRIAREQGLKNGFRTIINTGPGGGQEVFHLHIHVLGGGRLPGF
ncbi:MAG: histidine triad nucleotide-binding protein [Gammaproteobacteria bacterium]|nr:histidine triad nucleotide-binding protein [Gammaproteobacteria bacterium]